MLVFLTLDFSLLLVMPPSACHMVSYIWCGTRGGSLSRKLLVSGGKMPHPTSGETAQGLTKAGNVAWVEEFTVLLVHTETIHEKLINWRNILQGLGLHSVSCLVGEELETRWNQWFWKSRSSPNLHLRKRDKYIFFLLRLVGWRCRKQAPARSVKVYLCEKLGTQVPYCGT